MEDQLLDSWDIHNRMLFMLFDAIEPDGFQGKPVGISGRSVGNIFAHIHNQHFYSVEVHAPKLLGDLVKIPVKSKAEREAITGAILRPALVKSAETIRAMLQYGVEGGKLKANKPHFIGMFSYFIAHEWYHVGEICMTLTQSGHRLPDSTLYGIWSWGRWNPSDSYRTDADG